MNINKEKILHHIKNTRIWLDKAQAFAEKNNILRAIMVLFLAAAEVRIPLKESMEKSQTLVVKKSKIREFLPVATIAASILLIIGVAGYLYIISLRAPVVTKMEEERKQVTVKIEKAEIEKTPILSEDEKREPEVLFSVDKKKSLAASSPQGKVKKITKIEQKVYRVAKKERTKSPKVLKKKEKPNIKTSQDTKIPIKVEPLPQKTIGEIEVLELVNVAENALKGKTD